jgi:hypothetical protein
MVPTVHKSTEAFRKLPLDKRGCRMNNEHIEDNSPMFKIYTQKLCIFECMLNNVVANEVSICFLNFDTTNQLNYVYKQSKCVPWDYPTPQGLHGANDLPMCTSYKGDGYNNSLGAFTSAMEDSKYSNPCLDLCLPNCDETSYEYGIDTTELNTEELCKTPYTRKVAYIMLVKFMEDKSNSCFRWL